MKMEAYICILNKKIMTDYRPIIEAAWEDRSLLEQVETQDAIRAVINQIDAGELRCAAPSEEGWIINEWVKKAVVLYFPIQKMETGERWGPLGAPAQSHMCKGCAFGKNFMGQGPRYPIPHR